MADVTFTEKQVTRLRDLLQSSYQLGHRVQEIAWSLPKDDPNREKLVHYGSSISANVLVINNELFEERI